MGFKDSFRSKKYTMLNAVEDLYGKPRHEGESIRKERRSLRDYNFGYPKDTKGNGYILEKQNLDKVMRFIRDEKKWGSGNNMLSKEEQGEWRDARKTYGRGAVAELLKPYSDEELKNKPAQIPYRIKKALKISEITGDDSSSVQRRAKRLLQDFNRDFSPSKYIPERELIVNMKEELSEKLQDVRLPDKGYVASSIILIIGGLVFLSPNITGNAVANLSNSTSFFIGAGLFIIGLIFGSIVFKLKK